MNGLEEEYKGSLNFYRFDANDPDNQTLQNELQLRGHPSVAVVDNQGIVVSRTFGSQPADLFRPILDELAQE